MTQVLEPDAQLIAYGILSAALTPVRVVDRTPADMGAADSPIVQVHRIGGPGDTYGVFDYPTLAVHAYATSQQAANDLCRHAMQAFFDARGGTYNNGVLQRVRKLSGPSWAPTDNQDLRHAVTLLQVTIKAVF